MSIIHLVNGGLDGTLVGSPGGLVEVRVARLCVVLVGPVVEWCGVAFPERRWRVRGLDLASENWIVEILARGFRVVLGG